MKVYLSVDMEGIAGISHPNPTNRGDAGYPVAVELMTAEANAAIAGCRAGGATESSSTTVTAGCTTSIREPSMPALDCCRARSPGRWSPGRAPTRALAWPSSSATTHGPVTRPERSPTPSPGVRPRPV